MFVALEGIDGVGKSTVHEMLSQSPTLKEIGFSFGSKKEIRSSRPFTQETSSLLSKLVWPNDDGMSHPDLGNDYWMHINSSWFLLYSRVLRHEPTPRIFLDHWHYRFQAKMLTKGIAKDVVERAFSGCLDPDLVILLDGEPSALKERRQYKPQECGYMDDPRSTTREAYIKYQDRIRSLLRSMAVERGWTMVQHCHRRTPLSIVSEIEKHFSKRN